MFTLKFYSEPTKENEPERQLFLSAKEFAIEILTGSTLVRAGDETHQVGGKAGSGPSWDHCFIENSAGKTIHRVDGIAAPRTAA